MKYLKIAFFATFLFLSVGFACNDGGKSNGQQGQLTYNVSRPNPAPDAAHPECLYDETSYHKTSPNGVTVRYCGALPPEALAAIERGIAHQIRNSSHYNPTWAQFRNLNEYQVFLVPPDTHNVETDPGSPAIYVHYLTMNSDVGQVQSAGTCIGVDGTMFVPHKGPVADPRYPSEVLPYEDGELPAHVQYLEESARNESEHLAEWMNDKTMFHSFAIVGDQHPHFPDPAGM